MNITSIFKRKAAGAARFGLDIRADGIALARAGGTADGKPVLDICNFYPLDSGQSHLGLLQHLVREHKLSSIPCNAVLQPQYYNLLQVEAPDVPPEELKAAVRWRIKDIIDFHIDDAVIDVFEVPHQRNQRMHLLYVVVARKPHIESFIDLVDEAGITLDVIDIPELVLRNLSSIASEQDKSSALLYIGHDSGKILVNKNATMIISRSIDVGITRIMETTEGVDPEMIEAGLLPDEMIDVLDNIVLELQRSLDYYDSNWSGSMMESTLILPMEAAVPALMPHIFNTLGGVIKTLDVNEVFSVTEPLTYVDQAKCLCAIGAALRRSQHVNRNDSTEAA